jgi:hypothetical protein
MPDRPQKITFGEMREMGMRGLLIYCQDYKCSHSLAISGDTWADDVRLSDIEARFVCKACGKRDGKRPTSELQSDDALKLAKPNSVGSTLPSM